MMFDFYRNAVLNGFLSGQAISASLSQVALLTVMPEPIGSLTEPVGGNYARVNTATNWTVPVNGVSVNSATITFNRATASWGTILGFAILTGSGNQLFWGALRTPLTIDQYSPALSLPPGSIIVNVNGGLGDIMRNNILTVALINTVQTLPPQYFLGLSSVLPENDEVTGWSEPTIGTFGYARTPITNATAWLTSTAGFSYNLNTINIPNTGSPTGPWGLSFPMVAWGLWDTSAGGRLYFFGRLRVPITVTANTPTISIAPGQLQIGLDLAAGWS